MLESLELSTKSKSDAETYRRYEYGNDSLKYPVGSLRLRQLLTALRCVLRFPGGTAGGTPYHLLVLAAPDSETRSQSPRSDAASRGSSTQSVDVVGRLTGLSLSVALLDHQRLVPLRKTINELAREVLSALTQHPTQDAPQRDDISRQSSSVFDGGESCDDDSRAASQATAATTHDAAPLVRNPELLERYEEQQARAQRSTVLRILREVF